MRDVMMVLYHFWQARRLMKRFKTRNDLEKWQQECLKNFMRYTLVNSPFYSEYSGKSLQDIPIINKQIMMDEFDRINTEEIRLSEALDISKRAEESRDFAQTINDITVGLSSGTSGKQSVFLASKNERLKWAGIMLAKALPGSITQPHKIAFFLRANSNLYTTLSKSKHIQFNFFDLTTDFEDNLKLLNNYKPTILTAPASVLKRIAVAQENGQIDISPLKIFSAAEVLDPADQIYIETVFGQTVHQIYQCTEGFLGITNSDGKLYLNEEYIHIEKEWIDRESGRFVPIITDFSRTTQPIVRYRLDDVLVEDFSDTTPFTCLEAIEGRCDDICYFESEDGDLKPIFADILRQAITKSNASFEEYKIVQHSPQNLEVQLLPKGSKDCEEAIAQSIKQLCEKQNCVMPHLQFTEYKPNQPHQKLKRIERSFNIGTQEAA
jgi:putative adenylate-forming enzyme